jgi:hypothetical protein
MVNRSTYDQKIKPSTSQKTILVDPLYNPELQSTISARTELANGITMATFLGGRGDGTTLNHFTDPVQRGQVARNLYMQAYAMSTIRDSQRFANYRLIVDEGLYKPGPTEIVTPGSINDLAQTGRAIAYKIFNSAGVEDVATLFDVAIYWKDFILFEKLICDYDIYNPDGSLDFQLILVMPEIATDWSGSFTKKLETIYNGNSQTTGELIEVLS